MSSYLSIEELTDELEEDLKDRFEGRLNKGVDGDDGNVLPADLSSMSIVRAVTESFLEEKNAQDEIPFVFEFSILGGEEIKRNREEYKSHAAVPLEKKSPLNDFGIANLCIPKDELKKYNAAVDGKKIEESVEKSESRSYNQSRDFDLVKGNGPNEEAVAERDFTVVVCE